MERNYLLPLQSCRGRCMLQICHPAACRRWSSRLKSSWCCVIIVFFRSRRFKIIKLKLIFPCRQRTGWYLHADEAFVGNDYIESGMERDFSFKKMVKTTKCCSNRANQIFPVSVLSEPLPCFIYIYEVQNSQPRVLNQKCSSFKICR